MLKYRKQESEDGKTFVCPVCSARIPVGMTYCFSCQTVFSDEQLKESTHKHWFKKILKKDPQKNKDNGSGVKDIVVIAAILILQIVLAVALAPYLGGDAEDVTHKFLGLALVYTSIVGLVVAVVRNQKRYNRLVLIPVAIILYVLAWFESRYIGVPAASYLLIIYFQVSNNNSIIRDGVVAFASTCIVAGIIPFAVMVAVHDGVEMNGYQQEQIPQEMTYSTESGCDDLTTDDTLFVRDVLHAIFSNPEIGVRDYYERFNKIKKECPILLRKLDISKTNRVIYRYFEDLIETIRQQKPVTSTERIKLYQEVNASKQLIETHRRNLNRALNSGLIINEGLVIPADTMTIKRKLKDFDKITKMAVAKYDSLYDSTLVFSDSVQNDTLVCSMTASDSEFVNHLYSEIWDGTASINKDTYLRFQGIYKNCTATLLPPIWYIEVPETILMYEDLASSLNRRQIVKSYERMYLDETIIKQQDDEILNYLKDDTVRPENGGAPFVLDSETVIYNLKNLQEKALVAIKKLDSLYTDSLYVE